MGGPVGRISDSRLKTEERSEGGTFDTGRRGKKKELTYAKYKTKEDNNNNY